MGTLEQQAESWLSRAGLMMDALPVLLVYCDAKLSCRFCNATCRDWFGLREEEIIGKSLRAVLGPKAFRIVEPHARRVLAGEQVSFIDRLPYRHGPARTVSVHYIPDRAEDGPVRGYYAMIEDIGERVSAAEAGSQLAAIVKSSGDAILAKTLTGIVTAWNEAAESMYGYTAGEMIGERIAKVVPRARRGELERTMASIREGKVVKSLETRRLRKDGSEFDVSLTVSPILNAEGVAIGASSIARDISERIAGEEKLRSLTQHLEDRVAARTAELEKSRTRLKSVFEMAADGILTIDHRGKIGSSNPAMESMFGYPQGVVGRRVRELFPKSLRQRLERSIWAIFEGGGIAPSERILRAEEEALRFDGSTFPVEVAVSRNSGAGGGAILIMRDITDRRRMEREVLRASEEERRRIAAELHDSLGSQLGGVDCRLAGVQSALESIAPAEAEELRRISSLLADAMRQARTISHSLYAVGTEPDSLVHSLRTLTATAQAHAGIKARFHCPKPVTMSNRNVANHLYRIAQEAVNNAVRHSGGTQITIGLVESEHRVSVAVKDNGHGDLPDGPTSTGIGLQIMRYRANAIGGSLVMQKRRRGGLEVACSVPRARCERVHDS